MATVDVMEAYASNPQSLLEQLKEACEGERAARLTHVPYSFDLPGFPTAGHINQLVTVYGTVLKLGGIKFRNGKDGRVDYQEIQIQERSNVYLPQSISVHLEGALVHSCHPGELLRITGVVRVVWHKIRHGCPLDCGYVITALTVEKQAVGSALKELQLPGGEYRRLVALLEHYAPHLSGHWGVKLGLLLCTIGGQNKKEDGAKETAPSTAELYKETQYRHRASSHLLLVGPSGTGKTELLLFAAKTVSPAVNTTGTGCSSAGLTACAVREQGEWMIEPGALPQADRGVCCIDEFTALRKEEKASILEAMEQQTITVAKAGILMRLDTRCTVVATAQHGQLGREQVLPSLKLSPPLVSRFDLILPLKDSEPDHAAVARRILERAGDEYQASYIREVISRQQAVQVEMSPGCRGVISKFYERQRALSAVTVRALESHIRLAEAYAKLMDRAAATEHDALMAALLLNASLSLKQLWSWELSEVLQSETRLNQALRQARDDLLGGDAGEVKGEAAGSGGEDGAAGC